MSGLELKDCTFGVLHGHLVISTCAY
uniref:Uncharacterized protein n=1 Tax=Anguilla anguilla TaxID=7936 RepID=A0A0E9SVA9_ANGAN